MTAAAGAWALSAGSTARAGSGRLHTPLQWMAMRPITKLLWTVLFDVAPVDGLAVCSGEAIDTLHTMAVSL